MSKITYQMKPIYTDRTADAFYAITVETSAVLVDLMRNGGASVEAIEGSEEYYSVNHTPEAVEGFREALRRIQGILDEYNE
jgi:hypothetical protein